LAAVDLLPGLSGGYNGEYLLRGPTKMLSILQILFFVLSLALVVVGQRALDVAGIQPYISLSTVTVAGGVLLWFLHGEGADDAKESLRQKAHFVLLSSSRRALGSCVLLAFAVWSLYAYVDNHATVVFSTDQDDPITVYLQSNNGETEEGYISKTFPFKKSFSSGHHTFLCRAGERYQEQPEYVDVKKSGFKSDEIHRQITLLSVPSFKIQDAVIAPAYENAADLNHYPERLLDQPSHVLQFSVACSSPTPYQISRIDVKVLRAEPIQEWSFPYYCEGGYGCEAVVTEGYVELNRKQAPYSVTANQTNKVGAKSEIASYRFRLFSTPGYRYTVKIILHWADINRSDRSDKYESRTPIMFENRRDWRPLLADAQDVRILYNCRVKELYMDLDRLTPRPSYSLLVADPNAAEFFKREGIKLRAGSAIVPTRLQDGLTKLVSTTNPSAPRPCSFLILDEQRLLLQDKDKPRNGLLITDINRIRPIAKEYDRLRRQLIGK
jgi:hypothetical protein